MSGRLPLSVGGRGACRHFFFFHTCVGVARKLLLIDSTAVRIHVVWNTNATSHFVLWCVWTCPILMLCVQDPVLPVASIAVGPSVWTARRSSFVLWRPVGMEERLAGGSLRPKALWLCLGRPPMCLPRAAFPLSHQVGRCPPMISIRLR